MSWHVARRTCGAIQTDLGVECVNYTLWNAINAHVESKGIASTSLSLVHAVSLSISLSTSLSLPLSNSLSIPLPLLVMSDKKSSRSQVPNGISSIAVTNAAPGNPVGTFRNLLDAMAACSKHALFYTEAEAIATDLTKIQSQLKDMDRKY